MSSPAEAPNFVLFEHAIGYTILTIKEFEDVGILLPEVRKSVTDPDRFQSIVKLHAFYPFENTDHALDNCKFVSEGLMHQDLFNFLDAQLPKKKKVVMLGVGDSRLGSSIAEKFPSIQITFIGPVTEILRCIRTNFSLLLKGLPHSSIEKSQLSLGHSYSRSKVKFDAHRVDSMIIQSIALLDQLDKDINLFGMRIREWYSYHYPELFRLVPDLHPYVRCASVIGDRKLIDETTKEKIREILGNEEKTESLLEAARTSMGMEISDLDLMNIDKFAKRVSSLVGYRTELHQYVRERMDVCAPSLSALVGEQVGARLISHAGSLTNLAKYPASTIQILGAEKALFRALKTRTNTPKYGLIYQTTFIGKAAIRNKGRISRFVANKCALASRIDSFSDIPIAVFGQYMRKQVDDRLKYFETGEAPPKNIDTMKAAIGEASEATIKIIKKQRKEAKRAKKQQQMQQPDSAMEGNLLASAGRLAHNA